jgi:hypothetical protein
MEEGNMKNITTCPLISRQLLFGFLGYGGTGEPEIPARPR